MPHPSGCSYPRHEYYRKYYWLHKERYKLACEDRKQRKEELNKLYEEYGGEKAYHYNSLMKWLKEAKENKILRDLSNINLN
tara:strand:+ start:515 stop:757 length:243 start_codon:yes stop_codon:yes gene_type:complete